MTKPAAAPEPAEMSSNVSPAAALRKQRNNTRIKANYIKWPLPKRSFVSTVKVGSSNCSGG